MDIYLIPLVLVGFGRFYHGGSVCMFGCENHSAQDVHNALIRKGCMIPYTILILPGYLFPEILR